MQERMGDLGVESYYQSLINPQALQLDTRVDDLDLLYFSDYGTGYIYTASEGGEVAASEEFDYLAACTAYLGGF